MSYQASTYLHMEASQHYIKWTALLIRPKLNCLEFLIEDTCLILQDTLKLHEI
jgi:desulfoferrodoxin (superoxide reductase-like protein)